MHGEAGVAGDFVETLACGHSLLYHVVISRYYVIYNIWIFFSNLFKCTLNTSFTKCCVNHIQLKGFFLYQKKCFFYDLQNLGCFFFFSFKFIIYWKLYCRYQHNKTVYQYILKQIKILVNHVPFCLGWTPLARHNPPNLLLKILFPSNVAVALFVISTPAAFPSKIRLRRNMGWLLVLIKTPAWAFLNISFSSRIPVIFNK